MERRINRNSITITKDFVKTIIPVVKIDSVDIYNDNDRIKLCITVNTQEYQYIIDCGDIDLYESQIRDFFANVVYSSSLVLDGTKSGLSIPNNNSYFIIELN